MGSLNSLSTLNGFLNFMLKESDDYIDFIAPLKCGISPLHFKELRDHSSLGTTEIYSHVCFESLSETMGRGDD